MRPAAPCLVSGGSRAGWPGLWEPLPRHLPLSFELWVLPSPRGGDFPGGRGSLGHGWHCLGQEPGLPPLWHSHSFVGPRLPICEQGPWAESLLLPRLRGTFTAGSCLWRGPQEAGEAVAAGFRRASCAPSPPLAWSPPQAASQALAVGWVVGSAGRPGLTGVWACAAQRQAAPRAPCPVSHVFTSGPVWWILARVAACFQVERARHWPSLVPCSGCVGRRVGPSLKVLPLTTLVHRPQPSSASWNPRQPHRRGLSKP